MFDYNKCDIFFNFIFEPLGKVITDIMHFGTWYCKILRFRVSDLSKTLYTFYINIKNKCSSS